VAAPRKEYPARKKCTGACGKTRVISKFRLLSSGYRQGMCIDCERSYERERWHTRRPRLRRAAAAVAG
jgi:hypothetical protein